VTAFEKPSPAGAESQNILFLKAAQTFFIKFRQLVALARNKTARPYYFILEKKMYIQKWPRQCPSGPSVAQSY
jgi:hypothetical protein